MNHGLSLLYYKWITGMAQAQDVKETADISSFDKYFGMIQSRKKLPRALQETLTAAFLRIPVSSFPQVPGGEGNRNYFTA